MFLLLLLLQLLCRKGYSQSCSENGLLRLVNGENQYEGRVEVCRGFRWGTVCDDNWGNVDAMVVCRQLGYPTSGAVAVSTFFTFGPGSGPIHMDEVACRGNEARLLNCSHITNHNCVHFEDAGVRCPVCVPGSVRLQGSLVPGAGRVEVCSNSAWGTVCDDNWGDIDASVVCRQLNFSRFGASALPRAFFGPGRGQILMDEVTCSGSERRLVDCTHFSSHNCQHLEDASVRCNTTLRCQDGEVRLSGGSTRFEGRVEICFNETWGTICNRLWSSFDARVVCRQLGFTTSAARTTAFGPGSGPIHLSDFVCQSTEAKLVDCPHTMGTSSCTHSNDAGVTCQTVTVCTEGEVRLMGGNSSRGRVEVCYQGAWGTVCDDSWDSVDAGVVCGQLNFSRHNAIAHGSARFGFGSGPIHLDDVECSGSELRLLDCRRQNRRHNCFHTEDAGVTCNTTKICINGDIRLNGTSALRRHNEGRVEVCWNETWGSVCDRGWNSNDARVACRQLGFATQGYNIFFNAQFGPAPTSVPILLDQLACTGRETRLVDCRHSGVGTVSSLCNHNEEAGVRCRAVLCQNGAVQLVGGVSPYEGRVEVCENFQWGTVCDDFWQERDARVVCRQLGFTHPTLSAIPYSSAFFGEGIGPIFMDDVTCLGSETRLSACSHSNVNNCGHSEDASVRCRQCVEGSVRLRGGSTPFEGRVEICLGGGWGTVCDDGWSSSDAIVTCRQLGFGTTGVRPTFRAQFGQAPELTIAMDAVACRSSERRLADCSYRNSTNLRSCSHQEDAGVICGTPPIGPPQNVTFSNVGSREFTLNWALPASVLVPITGFALNCTNQDGYPTWRRTVTGNTTLSFRVTGVEEFTLYTCCVAALGRSEGLCNSSITGTAPPSAPPINVRGRPISSRSLTVEWDPPVARHRNGIIQFYMVQFTSSDDQSSVFFLVATNTISVTALHPHYTYNCTVAAHSFAGEGPRSDPISIRTFQDVPSGPPSDVTVTSTTANSLTFRISQPFPENRNGIITGYSIRLTHASSGRQTTYTSQVGTQFTASSLTPYTRYSYAVAASTVNGTGPYSQTRSTTTSETAPSRAPTGVTATPQSATTANITWTSISQAYRNGVIRHYTVRLISMETGTQRTLTSRGISLLRVSSLHPAYTYSVSVAGYTVAQGPFSRPITMKMPEAPPGPPINIVVTAIDRVSFRVSWDPPPPDQQNGVITGYTVHLRSPGLTTNIFQHLTGTQHVFSSLLASTEYEIRVAARNGAGIGRYSGATTFQTSVTAPSSAPTRVTLSASGSRLLNLRWRNFPSEDWNGDRRGFKIVLVELDTNQTRNFTLRNSAATSYTISSLHPFYSYQCSIAAFNSAGLGPFSAVVSEMLPEDEPSSYPLNISVIVTSSRSFTLSWEPPAPEDRNGIITRYTVSVLTVEEVRIFISTSQTSLQFPTATFDVLPYQSYTLQVAAETVAGRGPFSMDVAVSTPEDIPTHFPQDLVGEVLNSTSFRLRWNPPPEEHHNGEIREYRVNITEIRSGRMLQFTTATTELVVTDLHPYFQYESVVTAVTVGEGPYSAAVGLRTHEAAPSAPPQNVSTTFVSSTSISLTWQPPEEGNRNGEIRSYRVLYTERDGAVQRLRSNGERITLSGLEPFTTYTIRIAAYTVAFGPYSELRVTTEVAPPGAPRNLNLRARSPTVLRASWLAPDERDNNGVILSYRLTLRDLQSQESIVVNTTSVAYIWSELHPYYWYSVSVAAATSAGYGPSLYARIEMPEAAPSSSPVNITITNISPTSVSASWTPPPAEDHNGIIQRFRLQLVETRRQRTVNFRTSATSFLFDSLEENYNYSLTVAAETVAVGPFSMATNFTTLPDRPDEGPTNLEVTAQDAFTVSASWSPPRLRNRNGVILHYIVNISRTTTNGNEAQLHNTSETNLVTGSLHPYYSYYYSVAAENSVGRSPFSRVTVTMPQAPPSGPPQNVRARHPNSRTLNLTWAPPAEDMQNGFIRHYLISLRSTQDAETDRNFTVSVNTLVVENLRPFHTYELVVTAVTIGPGPSTVINSQMPEDSPAVAPLNFVASRRPTSIALQWTAIPVEHRNGIIAGYAVTVVPSHGLDSPRELILEPSLVSFEVSGLTPDVQYNVTITAFTSAGRGPTAEAQVTLLPRVPSVAPVVGEIVRVSAVEIQISWLPVSSDSEDALTYLIRHRPIREPQTIQKRNADDLAVVSTTNQTNFAITGLDPRFAYAVSVAASNEGGLGNYSEEVIVGLFDSSPFKVHFAGAIVCIPWLTHDSNVKLDRILNLIVSQLRRTCSCQLSAKYIASSDLVCGDRTTDRVILQGNLIGAQDSNSASLHTQLQSWVDGAPVVEVIGSQFEVVPCSTYPGQEDTCALVPATPTTATTIPRVANAELSSSTGLSGVTLYAAVGGGVAVLLLIVLVVVLVVLGIKKRRRGKFTPTRNMHTGINIGLSSGVTNPFDIDVKESKLDMKPPYDLEDDHIYDDPNLLVDSCLKMPLPPTKTGYSVLDRGANGKDENKSLHAHASQPSVGKEEVVSFSTSDGRYTSVSLQPTSAVKPAPAPQMPSHYSSPKPLVSATRPATALSPTPTPIDYAVPNPSLKPSGDEVPTAAPLPPGYASPKPISSLLESSPEKTKLAGEEEDAYFPLKKCPSANNTYQALVRPSQTGVETNLEATVNSTQKQATTTSNNNVTPNIEEEEYVDMQSPKSDDPEFPE